jgi:asparagine synthase (glutamine-hydrolysing)
MSGIMGIYYPDGRSIDREDIEKMVKILEHRGKDGSGVWHKNSVGLGHRLLWTTPESLLETLPLGNRSGNYILTADARIDNRDELIDTLNLTNCPAEKITDSQLILSAYEKWGESCPEKLLGDFAFVIWDQREQKLFCARDHFGVKPFYYYYLPNKTFIFASEIKAILTQPEVPCELNEEQVFIYLTWLGQNHYSTFYQNILRLPPGHSITVTSANINLQCYWSLNPEKEIRLNSDGEYAEALQEIFIEAVRCRLRSAFPLGSHLSGGLDSSSITCVARNILLEEQREALNTFSARFGEDDPWDERVFQNTVITQGNLKPHYLQADLMGPFTDIETVLWHQDEAFRPANSYFDWGMYGLAQKLGIRVMLDGFDGDSTISHGTNYLRELASSGKWLTLMEETTEYGKTWNISRQQVLKVQLKWAWQYGIAPKVAPAWKQFKSIYRNIRPLPAQLNNKIEGVPLNPDFITRMDLSSLEPKRPKTEKERHYKILTDDVLQHCLECTDRTAAAFSVEPRMPFCDRRLLEFCLALPSNQKLHHGWERIVMRRAMEGILPSEIQWRVGKANFAPGLERGLFTYERKRVEYVIMQKPQLIERYFDIDSLQDSYYRFIDRQATESDVNTLHRAVSLGLSLEHTKLTA